MVCYVAQNAGVIPSFCGRFGFVHAPSVREYVETRSHPSTTAAQLCDGCLEFAFTSGVCATGNPICVNAAEQANVTGALPAANAFYRAAQTWKVGTDTLSGADHNCHAMGFCGPVSHSFLLSADQKSALGAAAASAAEACGSACSDGAATCTGCGEAVSALAAGTACPTGASAVCQPFAAALRPVATSLAELATQYQSYAALTNSSAAALAEKVCEDVGACGVAWQVGPAGFGSSVATLQFTVLVRELARTFAEAWATLAAYNPATPAGAELAAAYATSYFAKARAVAQAGTALTFSAGPSPGTTRAVLDAASSVAATVEGKHPAAAAMLRSMAASVAGGKLGADYQKLAAGILAALPAAEGFSEAAQTKVLDVVGIAYDDYIIKVNPKPPSNGLLTLLTAFTVALPAVAMEIRVPAAAVRARARVITIA